MSNGIGFVGFGSGCPEIRVCKVRIFDLFDLKLRGLKNVVEMKKEWIWGLSGVGNPNLKSDLAYGFGLGSWSGFGLYFLKSIPIERARGETYCVQRMRYLVQN